MGGAVRLCKAPSCVVCSAGAGVWSIRIGGDIWRLCGLLGAFLASGPGFGELVRGAPGARRSGRERLYILILHRLLIYTYTHSIYNILNII